MSTLFLALETSGMPMKKLDDIALSVNSQNLVPLLAVYPRIIEGEGTGRNPARSELRTLIDIPDIPPTDVKMAREFAITLKMHDDQCIFPEENDDNRFHPKMYHSDTWTSRSNDTSFALVQDDLVNEVVSAMTMV